MNASRLWTIARLELLQRLRTVSWYVLLGVFALLLVGVTVLSFLIYGGWDADRGGVYSVIVYITLLLVLLVSPTLSGNSINGDRDAATLAPVQVTLATTGEILFGKLLAAWITGLAFALVAVPFLIIATIAGGAQAASILTSLAVLIVETGIIAAIGVALSGILARPLFSVAVTYLVVAALAVGTVVGFGLVGSAISSEATSTSSWVKTQPNGEPVCKDGREPCSYNNFDDLVCEDPVFSTYRVPRFDKVWWLLSANPFVILADATPTSFDANGNTEDMFGSLKYSVRLAQREPALRSDFNECDPAIYLSSSDDYESPEEVVATTVPSWFVGLGVQLMLAAALLWWAWARTRTPARKLPPGTRIA